MNSGRPSWVSICTNISIRKNPAWGGGGGGGGFLLKKTKKKKKFKKNIISIKNINPFILENF
jgi:hypothetical protein